ncbi:hypothetical protein ACQPZJ_16370 [Actinoplanes sp. CA-054009]
MIGNDSYTANRDAGPWVHADMGRLEAGHSYRVVDPKDPTGVSGFVAGLIDVQRAGPRSFKGASVVNGDHGTPVGAPVIVSAQKQVVVYCTATVDAHGRLTSMQTDFTSRSDGLLSQTMTFSGHGQPVTAVKPADAAELGQDHYGKVS